MYIPNDKYKNVHLFVGQQPFWSSKDALFWTHLLL